MTHAHQPMKYRPDIDGLRAIAVGAVVLFHAKLPFVAGGFVGVDIFFVISGFLITAILLQDRSIARFYLRRARRILPALFALVGPVLLMAIFILLPHDLVVASKSAGAALLFSSNIWFWRQAGYFATETELWPLLHTWSLGVEEQFYIGFPIVMAILPRLHKHWLATLFAVLALLSFASAVFAMSHLKPVLAFYMAPMRAWELLIGSILATGAIGRPRGIVTASIVASAGLIAIVIAVIATSAATFPGVGALPAVLGTAGVIWAGQAPGVPVLRALGSAPMRFIGLISYSLYLWHWPVLAFARYVNVAPLSPVQRLLAVALAVALAVLSWRFVERPFRRGFSDRGIVIFSLVGMAGLLAVCGALVLANGLPGRFAAPVVALNADEGEDWRCPVTSFVPFGGFYACPINLPSRRVADADIVLWGDSHAQMYAPALQAALGDRSAILVNANGCAPISTTALDPSCTQIQRRNFEQIVKLPARTIVLAQNWPQYRDERAQPGAAPLPLERYGAGIVRLRALVRDLRRAGKQVIVIGPIALPGYNLASVAARDLAFHGAIRTKIGVTRQAYLDENANILRALDEMKRDPGVAILRPDRLMCDAARCSFIADGHAVFADHGHLTNRYVRRLAPLFAEALAQDP